MRIFGHPVHPAIVHLPIAGWLLAPFADLAFYLSGDPFWVRAAAMLNLAALAFAVPAVVAGAADLTQLRTRPEAAGMAMLHAALMSTATLAAVASAYLRLPFGEPSWSVAAAGASLVAAFATAAGGWCGGALVYAHGLGRRRSKE